jgi:hypothetical protein
MLWFLNIFAEKFNKKIGVLNSKKAKLCKKLIVTLVFEKNANFFLPKIVENGRKLWSQHRPLATLVLAHISGFIRGKRVSQGFVFNELGGNRFSPPLHLLDSRQMRSICRVQCPFLFIAQAPASKSVPFAA